MNLETIIEDFEFFDDWEDRYKYIMDLGKSLDPLSDDDYGKTNKVDGCASQVWLIINEEEVNEKTILKLKADSDSFLVKGLLAIIISIFSGKTPSNILEINYNMMNLIFIPQKMVWLNQKIFLNIIKK